MTKLDYLAYDDLLSGHEVRIHRDAVILRDLNTDGFTPHETEITLAELKELLNVASQFQSAEKAVKPYTEDTATQPQEQESEYSNGYVLQIEATTIGRATYYYHPWSDNWRECPSGVLPKITEERIARELYNKHCFPNLVDCKGLENKYIDNIKLIYIKDGVTNIVVQKHF